MARQLFVCAFIIFLFATAAPARAQAPGPGPFDLDITGISRDAFPRIDLRAYFRKKGSGSESALSSGNFSVTENLVPQAVSSFSREASSAAVALAFSPGFQEAANAGIVRSCVAAASGYLEGLDSLGVFSHSPGFEDAPFASDPSKFRSVSLGEGSSGLDASSVIRRCLGETVKRQGKKHVIYLTTECFEVSRELLEECSALCATDTVAVHVLHFPVFTGDIFGGGSGSASMAALAAFTGGLYREARAREAQAAVDEVMRYIKSNYSLSYESSSPYSNGRKRTVSLSADYMGTRSSDEVVYRTEFNLPDLDFGGGDNAFAYQEIDPVTIAGAARLGLSMSASVRFSSNVSGARVAAAYVGFGAYGIDGRPDGHEQFLVELDNAFMVRAGRYEFKSASGQAYLERQKAFPSPKDELIETRYLAKASGNGALRRAGIYWMPSFNERRPEQWARVFMSFVPRAIVTDGSVRYAIFLSGRSFDGRARDVVFDGVQLQYGAVPTVFTESQTIYLGPVDVTQTMPSPINPRTEYQMK